MMDGEQTPKKKRRIGAGFGLLAVQTISCLSVILTVLILRLVGGGLFEQLGNYFTDAMRQNTLTDAIHALWDDHITYTTAAPTTTTATEPTVTEHEETSEAAGTTTAAATPASAGAILPVKNGVVTSAFGERVSPITGEKEFHEGLDLGVPEGTPIAAIWDGEVMERDADGAGSYGKYVVLMHPNGIQILYAHCREITAEIGQKVKAGDTVALVGQTGAATGPHVHVEIRQNGTLCDPAKWLVTDESV